MRFLRFFAIFEKFFQKKIFFVKKFLKKIFMKIFKNCKKRHGCQVLQLKMAL